MIAATLVLTVVGQVAGNDPLQARIEGLNGTSDDSRQVIRRVLEQAKVSFVIHNDVAGRITYSLPAGTCELALYFICSAANASWSVSDDRVYRVYKTPPGTWMELSASAKRVGAERDVQTLRTLRELQIGRITLRNADAATAFRKLFSKAKVPFVVSAALQGTVTADLQFEPFEQVLRALCQGFNASYQRVAGVQMIIPRDPTPPAGGRGETRRLLQ